VSLHVFILVWLAVPWRCSPANPEPREDKPYGPKTDEEVGKRETLKEAPKPAVTRRVGLPEAVVVRALDAGQAGFLRCFKRGGEPSYKVQLHLELDATGAVTAASTDSADPALANCLARVGYTLPFPAPNQPAVVDLPLLFRL
jgi:hypothetical protein